MKKAALPNNEKERLELLASLQILDTALEDIYDDITRMASKICETPICLVSLVDSTRQWFKSHYGLDALQTPREYAFCAHAIHDKQVFIVEDAREDSRFFDNPLVIDDPKVVFYAGVPLEIKDGLSIGTLCVIDNKPRKLTEEQLKDLKSLAKLAASQLKLRLKNSELEKLMAAKSNFFANLSHEIRTPLNGIIGFAELLSDIKLPTEALKLVHHTKNCGESLLLIINDILDYSKIEAGRMSVEKVALNLEETLETSLFVFNSILSQKDVEFKYSIDKNIPATILGDSLRLRQIFINLIGNALKFTEKGVVEVSIDLHRQLPAGKFEIICTVRDTGIGISPAGQKVLFDAFEQVNSETTRKYGGTGLGLSICQKIIGMMGGKIWVESQEGKGTKIFFTFTGEEGLLAETSAKASTEQQGFPESSKVNLKILLAEDNKVNQILARGLLKKLGYSVNSVVENGQEVLARLKDESFDIILMDVQMPEMSGLDATKNIRSQLGHKSRPYIVGVSANVFPEDKEKGIESGMDDYIGKPIDIKKLSEIFQKYTLLKADAG